MVMERLTFLEQVLTSLKEFFKERPRLLCFHMSTYYQLHF